MSKKPEMVECVSCSCKVRSDKIYTCVGCDDKVCGGCMIGSVCVTCAEINEEVQ